MLPVKVNQKEGLIEFNFQELKKELEVSLQKYQNLVVTQEDLKSFEKTRADLNKVSKMINDEKIRIKKLYSEPLVKFENEVKELISMITTVNTQIDLQIKEFEDSFKVEKLAQIKEFHETVLKGRFKFDLLFDPKWLNKSIKLKDVLDELQYKHDKALDDISVLKQMNVADVEWLLAIYEDKLDVTSSLSEYNRLQDAIKKHSTIHTHKPKSIENDLETHENEYLSVSFNVKGTKQQLLALTDYLNSTKIEWEKL
jgi:hypothetical protein